MNTGLLIGAGLLGMGGSLHCVAMCSPIALALPQNMATSRFLTGQLLYNLGRTSTYVFLGFLLGLFGESIRWAGGQQLLSISLGTFLLLALILGHKGESWFKRIPPLQRGLLALKKQLGKLLSKTSLPHFYHLGILNGFLPCGLVYVALAGSLAAESLPGAAGFMLLFGLGTLPAMLGVAFLGKLPKTARSFPVQTVGKFVTFAFALLLILRGMNLGIPYVSPDLSGDSLSISTCVTD